MSLSACQQVCPSPSKQDSLLLLLSPLSSSSPCCSLPNSPALSLSLPGGYLRSATGFKSNADTELSRHKSQCGALWRSGCPIHHGLSPCLLPCQVNSKRIMTDPVFVLTSPDGDLRGIRREHQSVGLAEQEIDRRLCNELTNELHRSPPPRGSACGHMGGRGSAKHSSDALSSQNSLP